MSEIVLTREDIKSFFPKREKDCNKGTFGKAVIFGGCDSFCGAPKIAYMAEEAMRMGVGYAVLAVTPTVSKMVGSEVYESIFAFQDEKDGKFLFSEEKVKDAVKNARSVAVGMGMGKSEEVAKLVRFLLCNFNGNLIIDADGLNSVTKEDLRLKKNCSVVITPHLVEFSRLFNVDVETAKKQGEELAKKFAKEYGISVLLKGAESLVTDGETSYRTKNSSPSLAKAGSGDMLAGAICGLSANNALLVSSAVCSQLIAFVAADLSERYNENILLARDMINGIKEFFLKA